MWTIAIDLKSFKNFIVIKFNQKKDYFNITRVYFSFPMDFMTQMILHLIKYFNNFIVSNFFNFIIINSVTTNKFGS